MNRRDFIIRMAGLSGVLVLMPLSFAKNRSGKSVIEKIQKTKEEWMVILTPEQ